MVTVLTLASLLLLTLAGSSVSPKAPSTSTRVSQGGDDHLQTAWGDPGRKEMNGEQQVPAPWREKRAVSRIQESHEIQPAIHWAQNLDPADAKNTRDVGVAAAEIYQSIEMQLLSTPFSDDFPSQPERSVELESSLEFNELQLPSTPFSNDFPSVSKSLNESKRVEFEHPAVEPKSPVESKRRESSSIRLATVPPPPKATETQEVPATVVNFKSLNPPEAVDAETGFSEFESIPSVAPPAEGFWLVHGEPLSQVNSTFVTESPTNSGTSSELEASSELEETSELGALGWSGALGWLASTGEFENELPFPQVPYQGEDIVPGDSTTQFETLEAMGGEFPSVPEETLAELVQDSTQEMQRQAAAEPEWLQVINQPILRYPAKQNLSFFDALMQTVTFSPEIQVVRAELGIREQEIERQQGAFNWNQFVRSNWDELNQPVASALDGVANRLEQHTLQTTVGLRKPNALGGETQLSQELGFRDSNSSFFVPNNQALSNIALEYRQPLMRGAGRFVNTGLIQIASTDAKIGYEQLVQAIQRQLSEVSLAYWELVRARGAFVIQKQNFDRIAKIAEVVGNRQDIDISPVQLARVNAAVAANRNGLLQAEYTVVRAQDRFLRLVYGARFVDYADLEILPVCDFTGEANPLDAEFQIQLALQNRPEVLQAMQGIRRASIQNGIAENQLLPLLGLTLSLSNRGVVGDRQLGDAFSDQWSLGDPTYGAGLVYEFPFRNQAAKANAKQARLRLVQFQKQFEQTVADVVVDMRNALREVELSDQWRRLTAETMLLTQRELSALEQRALLLIDGDQLGTLYLDNLLQTQLRATSTEQEYLDATVGYFNSHFQLQRSNGTLLRKESPPVR